MTNKFQEENKKKYKKDHALKVEYVNEGIIHPLANGGENKVYGGVTDKYFNFIRLSLDKRGQGEANVPVNEWYIGANPDSFNKKINFINEDVVFIGPIKRHFAHFYLEAFCRCHFFLNKNNLKYRIAFLSSEDDVPRFDLVNVFFESIGIDTNNLIEIKKPLQFKTVIIPEQSFEEQLSYHAKYKDLIDRLKKSIPAANYKKIYFAKLPERVLGENLAVNIFEKNGYKVFTPEYLGAREMISILNGCEELVASSGSNAYNALFLNDKAKLVILNRSAHVHYDQTMINQMRNLNVTYVDSFTNVLPVSIDCGPYMFRYTEHLARYFKSAGIKYCRKDLVNASDENTVSFVHKWCNFYSDHRYARLLGNDKRELVDHFIDFWRKLKIKDPSDISNDSSWKDFFFSIKNVNKHKIIKFLGIKISLRKKNIHV
jgi:hypothetical protein